MILYLFSLSLLGDMKIGFEGKVGAFYSIKSFESATSLSKVGGILEGSFIGWYENTGFETTLGIASGPVVNAWIEVIFSKNFGSKKEGTIAGLGIGYYGVGGGSPGLVGTFQYQMLRDKLINLIPQIKIIGVYGRTDGIIRIGGEFLLGVALVI